MSSPDSIETPQLVTSSERLTGRVKWFNNKTGYGFITITDGTRAGSDIFVHHSGIMVSNEQYKYLVQGEYVGFKLDNTSTGAHAIQAGDVSGINGGKLMCETRHEFKQTRTNYAESGEEQPVRMPRSTRAPGSSTPDVARVRGQGPREGQDWSLVKGGREQTGGSGRGFSSGGRGNAPRGGRGRPQRSTSQEA